MTESLRRVLTRIDLALSTPEPQREGWGGFHLIPLLAFGARIGVTDEHACDDTLETFLLRGWDSDDPHLEPIDVVTGSLPSAGMITEYECERMIPSAAWSAHDQAWFWRVKGKAFWFDYGDPVLNLTIDALGRALPWHRDEAPLDALPLWTAQLRAKIYASYPHAEVLEELDALLALLERVRRAKTDVRVILEVCEILDRVRQSPGRRGARSAALRSLARVALDAIDDGAPDTQRARLLHALAHGLTHRGAEPIEESERSAIEARLGPIEQAAAAAWRQAIELEDGDFYGLREERRRADRVRQYRAELDRLELLQGDRAMAVAMIVDRIGTSPSILDARDATRAQVRAMADDDVPRAARLAVLEGIVEEILMGRSELDAAEEWQAHIALKLAELVDYHLLNLGGGPVARAAITEALALPYFILARATRDLKETASRAATSDAERSLLDAIFAGRGAPREPTEVELQRQGAERAVDNAIRATRADLLLIPELTRIAPDGSHVTVKLVVNAPSAIADVVKRELRVALAQVERDVRDSLTGATVTLELETICLGRGLSDPHEMAAALTYAGATRALERLRLEPTNDALWAESKGVDDRVAPEGVARLAAELRARVMHVRMRWT